MTTPTSGASPGGVETRSTSGRREETIFVVGLNHNTAPIQLREQLAFGAADVVEAARAAIESCGISECAILSTCNRSEIYAAAPLFQPDEIVQFLAQRQRVNLAELREHTYHYSGAEAVRHLCAVASGLDSMVLGENQILGQVKTAAQEAMAARTAGSLLSALFRQALTAGKRARTETGISRGAVSISHAAVELARTIFGELSGCRALVLGAGEMSEITLKLLRAAGMKTSIMISSRTRERAEALAERCHGVGVEWDQFPSALRDADIVLVSTSAPHYIVNTETVRHAMRARRNRHIFIIDISVPRNVEPSAGDLDDVFLYNIDDLQCVVERNLGDRSQEAAKVEQIVGEEVERFLKWKNSLGVTPAIVGLRGFGESVRQEELDRFAGRLSHLSERDRRTVDALTRQIVGSLLQPALTQLKELGVDGKGYDRVEILRELFGFSTAEPPGPEAEPPQEPILPESDLESEGGPP